MHPYGRLNIEEQRDTFKNHISNLRSIVQQHGKLNAGAPIGDKDVSKYFTLLKVCAWCFLSINLLVVQETSKLKTQVDQIYNFLDNCQAIGKRYLESGSAGTIYYTPLPFSINIADIDAAKQPKTGAKENVKTEHQKYLANMNSGRLLDAHLKEMVRPHSCLAKSPRISVPPAHFTFLCTCKASCIYFSLG